MSRRSAKVILGVCLVGLGLFGAGLALAGGRGLSSGEVVQACYEVSSGALRLVDSPAECTPRENSISWNKAGVAGPAGPMGVPGQAGPVGSAGKRGPAGTVAVRVQGNGGINLSGLLTLEQKLLIKTLARLKKIEQKLDAVNGKIDGLDENFNAFRAYAELRLYENCIGIEIGISNPTVATFRCKLGFFKALSDYDPFAEAE